jgi:predicted ATPase
MESEHMDKITSLSVKNFTAFREAKFEFSSGINVLIGENSTGKTHVLKLIYALVKIAKEAATSGEGELSQDTVERLNFFGLNKLNDIFRPEYVNKLTRQVQLNGDDTEKSVNTSLTLDYGLDDQLQFEFSSRYDLAPHAGQTKLLGKSDADQIPATLFLPGREIISIYPGFIANYQLREVPYDSTYLDLAVALNANPLRREKYDKVKQLVGPFEAVIGPAEHVSVENDHFYLKLPDSGKLEAQLVAEGYRKLAELVYLVRNGSLTPDSVLLWDEPEANMNPKLVAVIVEFLVNLANAGAQVFLATHDYLLSQELSLHAEYRGNKDIKFISLYRETGHDGTLVESGNTLADIQNNPILEGFIGHYEKEERLTYAIG